MKTESELWGHPATFDGPPYLPPSPEELAQRQRAGRELLAIRDSIGPIDLTWEELLAGDEPQED